MTEGLKMYEVALTNNYVVYATDADDAVKKAIQEDRGECEDYYAAIEVTALNTEKGEDE